jgi:hypothetical protein
MIVGDPKLFAIESQIQKAYSNPGLRALGYFLIHLDGRCYGKCEADATLLACSFDSICERIRERGRHKAPFSMHNDPSEVASSFISAIYSEQHRDSYFGILRDDFITYFSCGADGVMWAPDGDEAFDDGSYVLQFDVEDTVRIIAFKHIGDGRHDPLSLADIWLPAADYYTILESWRDSFLESWSVLSGNHDTGFGNGKPEQTDDFQE